MSVFNFFAKRIGEDANVSSWDLFPSFYELTGGRDDMDTDITPKMSAATGAAGTVQTAAKIAPGPPVTCLPVATTALGGVTLESELQGCVSAGTPLMLTGTLTLTDRTDYNSVCFRFLRYGSDESDRELRVCEPERESLLDPGHLAAGGPVHDRAVRLFSQLRGAVPAGLVLWHHGAMTVGLTIVRWPCVRLGTPARVAPATLAALVSIVVGSVVGGCVQREATSTVLVALGAERVRTDSPDAYVIRGQTVGVVCFDVSPPVTVAAEKAGALVDAFRASLASGSLPIETASTRVVLPVPVDGVEGEACDLVLFDDADGDGKWSSGESYVTGWSGGRGSYRLGRS